MTDIFFWSAAETALRIRRRDVSATEVTRAALDRMTEVNPRIKAIVDTGGNLAAEALEFAGKIDVAGLPEDPPPLYGVRDSQLTLPH
ncbi:hypothetical protein N4R57_20940 [Rhodobacteraceae bacterium D3-12]|nr:hypothetical protein N4R57_20940 [Rhodobacteraceae bacterium D3-12]